VVARYHSLPFNNLFKWRNIRSYNGERTHGKIARVKSAVRCSMSDDGLEHLMFVNVAQDRTGSLGLASLVKAGSNYSSL